MPSTLALLLCLLSIAFLLRNEQKQSHSVSRASWIPTFWVLYFASKPIARWIDPYGAIEESTADGLFLVGLIFLGLYVIAKRKLNWWAQVRQTRWLALLLGYMLLSCLWSDDPIGSFKQWVRVFGSFILALTVLTEKEPTLALQSIFRRTVYVLIPLSVVLIKYFPELGVVYRSWNGEKFWVGATIAKNGLGRLCLVCAVFLIWGLFSRWKGKSRPAWKYQTQVEILLLFIIGWLLKGPGSDYAMTAIVLFGLCAAALLALLVFNQQVANRFFSLFAGLTLVVAVTMTYCTVTGDIPSFGVQSLGRNVTFTGRTYIWDVVRKEAWENAILGVGYSAYWSRNREFPVVGMVNEGHNGYLDTFVETGVIGLIMLFIVLVSYIRRVSQERSYNFDWACFRIVFLFMLVVHNFTETTFLRSSEHLWALFILMYMIF